jgi:succinate dehydrogenase/fumarate reductase cytochrome b subunit
MGLPVKMNENERGVFALHGLTGMLIAVVLLLSILGVLGYNAVAVQKANAEVYYSVNQDINAIKFNSTNNNSFRTVEK